MCFHPTHTQKDVYVMKAKKIVLLFIFIDSIQRKLDFQEPHFQLQQINSFFIKKKPENKSSLNSVRPDAFIDTTKCVHSMKSIDRKSVV